MDLDVVCVDSRCGTKEEAGDIECGIAELNGEGVGVGYVGGRSKPAPLRPKTFRSRRCGWSWFGSEISDETEDTGRHCLSRSAGVICPRILSRS